MFNMITFMVMNKRTVGGMTKENNSISVRRSALPFQRHIEAATEFCDCVHFLKNVCILCNLECL